MIAFISPFDDTAARPNNLGLDLLYYKIDKKCLSYLREIKIFFHEWLFFVKIIQF